MILSSIIDPPDYYSWIEFLSIENGLVLIYLQDNLGNRLQTGYTTTLINDGTWHYLSMVYNGYGIKLYIDSNLEKEVSGSLGNLSTNDKTIIGYHSLNPYSFNGTLDEMLFYNRSLSADEILPFTLETTISNPSQIKLENITITSVINGEVYTYNTGLSLNSGELKTLTAKLPEGSLEKIRVSATNCPVYIEKLDVGECG